MATAAERTSITRLPNDLRGYERQIESALSTHVPLKWDDDEDFVDADQPAAIGAVLLRALSDNAELRGKTIGYLFREKMETRGKSVWGKASKVTGKLAHFSGLDFLIEFNWTAWRLLEPIQRIALVDHELMHCAIEWGDDGPKNVLRPHDLEEFGAIVRRYGEWRTDVRLFARALDEAPQYELFAVDTGTVTVSFNDESVTLTGDQLDRVAARITDEGLAKV